MGRALYSHPYHMEHHEPWWGHHQGPSGRTSAQSWPVLLIVLFIIKAWIHFKYVLIRNPIEGVTH